MKRLSSLNGWQRLWLVGTAIGLAYCLTVVPLNAVRDMRNWQYRSGIGYDYNSPACQSYIVQPFDALTEPPFGSGGTCWYIFTSRQFSAGHEIPATYADWEAKDERRIGGKVFPSLR